MNYANLKEITVERTAELYPEASYIGDDILLVDDLTKMRFPDEPRRVRCLILALCLQGNAEYGLDTIRYTVKEGDIIILNSSQVIDGHHQSADCKAVGFVISDPFYYEIFSGVHDLSSLFTFSRLHPVFHLSKEDQEKIVNYYHLIKQKVDQKDHRFRRDTVRSLIQALIYDAADAIGYIKAAEQIRNTRAEAIYINFMLMVEQHFRTERRVGWYAQQLSITPKYLSETIKQVSHRTPNDWIDDYVILEIRVLLRNTTKTIKEISEMMNFPNQSFFGKHFKEHVGMSPSEYRKS